MKPGSRSRLSKWLLAALLVVGMTSSGNALMIDTGRPPRPTNTCVYCFEIFGYVICISTSEPLPGSDIFACRL